MSKESNPEPFNGEWVARNRDELLSIFSECFASHSAKLVNSNISSTGVRVSRHDQAKMPYICTSSLLAAGEPLIIDCTGNAAVEGPYAKQLRAIEAGHVADIDPAQIELFKSVYEEVTEHSAVLSDEALNPRLRQIYLPKDNAYVVATPLPPLTVIQSLRNAIDQHNEEAKQERSTLKKGETPVFRKIVLAETPYGGANAQNVTSLFRAVTRTLYCPAPSSQPSIKEALSIYYRGFDSPFIPYAQQGGIPESVAEPLAAEVAQCQKRPLNAQQVMCLQQWGHKVGRYFMWLANHLVTLVAPVVDSMSDLPEGKRCVATRPNVEQGFFHPKQRDMAWVNETSAFIVQRLAHYSLKNGERMGLDTELSEAIEHGVKHVLMGGSQ
ncbi:hypothetical protein KCM76_22360 [Zooshikella marina]|uniref:type I-F CRISPR-associated protein Csy1 n=1 Tax=Zooshikella ganghwensis TaxID=202772 RepID=UPI001BAF2E9F|nr:type I-F CRISPR-associated protein Csy1 [Zooshikella ganghwensis]MBU2708753.1 hypothetical protein [Zooshikella ganghwensis]